MSKYFDLNDDEPSDWLDYISDKYADFFAWMDLMLDDIPEPDIDPDWDVNITEPSDSELRAIDEFADQLLEELENLKKDEDDDKRNP